VTFVTNGERFCQSGGCFVNDFDVNFCQQRCDRQTVTLLTVTFSQFQTHCDRVIYCLCHFLLPLSHFTLNVFFFLLWPDIFVIARGFLFLFNYFYGMGHSTQFFKKMSTIVDIQLSSLRRIFVLFEKYGSFDYIGEPVSQLSHSLQAAHAATSMFDPIIDSLDRNEFVAAALLHDIGHLVGVEAGEDDKMGGCGIMHHESVYFSLTVLINFISGIFIHLDLLLYR